jgi:lipopolysaccharide transport system permease protein
MCPEANVSSSRWADRELEHWQLAPADRLGVRVRAREIWRYRRILWFFSLKAIQSLYAKTRLGVFWLVARPLTPILVGSLIYDNVMQVPSGGVPYFLFLLTGMTLWNFFDGPLIFGSRGIDSNRQLLTKIYVPRLIMPMGQMAAGLMEPVTCVVIMMVATVYYRVTQDVWYVTLSPRLLAAIPSVALALFLAFSLSLWTSVWQARSRDAKFGLRYALGFWMLLTPVVYPASQVPQPFRLLVLANPMTGPVETFKWAVLGVGEPALAALAASAAVAAVTCALGLAYFGRVEGQLVDRL